MVYSNGEIAAKTVFPLSLYLAPIYPPQNRFKDINVCQDHLNKAGDQKPDLTVGSRDQDSKLLCQGCSIYMSVDMRLAAE